jgi:hypothetical protein
MSVLGRRTNTRSVALIAMLLATALTFGTRAAAGLRYGLDFFPPAEGAWIPYFGSIIYLSRMSPYALTAPDSRFVIDGGLVGRTDAETRLAVRNRLEDRFRAIDTGDPSTTLAITFELGLVNSPASRNIVLGRGHEPPGILGSSFVGTALDPEFPAGFAGAVVFIDKIAAIESVQFNTFDAVVNAIANVAAHEIGNTLGLEDVLNLNDGPPYSVMTTGALGLPSAGWLGDRAFFDHEQLPAGGTQHSVQHLINELGTVRRGDFDRDGDVDSADLLTASPFWLRDGVAFHEGDADGDHRFDSADLLLLSPYFNSGPSPLAIPEPDGAAFVVAAAMAAALLNRLGRLR